MLVSRRQALTIVSGIVLGITTAGSSGAFDRVELDRAMTVEVDGDAGAYLSIEVHPDREGAEGGPDVGTDEEGRIYLDFSEPHLNDLGLTRFHDLLLIENNGSKDISIDVYAVDAAGDRVSGIEAFLDKDPSIRMPHNMTVDTDVVFGLEFDTTEDDIESATHLRFEATSDPS
ncbi:MAG: hypothetical protein ACLFMX_01035 [Halobacteriales archaeon]